MNHTAQEKKPLPRINIGARGVLHTGRLSLEQTILLNSAEIPIIVRGQHCILESTCGSMDSYRGTVIRNNGKRVYVKVTHKYIGDKRNDY